jgi:hypothetical protein
MCGGCARAIVRRIRISPYDGASARCSAPNRQDRPSASPPLTPPSTTLSMSSATSPPAPRSESSETKRSTRGGLRPQPESQLKLPRLTPPIRVPVTAPSRSRPDPWLHSIVGMLQISDSTRSRIVTNSGLDLIALMSRSPCWAAKGQAMRSMIRPGRGDITTTSVPR